MICSRFQGLRDFFVRTDSRTDRPHGPVHTRVGASTFGFLALVGLVGVLLAVFTGLGSGEDPIGASGTAADLERDRGKFSDLSLGKPSSSTGTKQTAESDLPVGLGRSPSTTNAESLTEKAAGQGWELVADEAIQAMLSPLRRSIEHTDETLAGFALSGGEHGNLERAVRLLLERQAEPAVSLELALERARVHSSQLARLQRDFLWAQLYAAESKLASGDFERRRVGEPATSSSAPSNGGPSAPTGKLLGLMFYGGSEWFASCRLTSGDVPGCEQHQEAIKAARHDLQQAILQ
jgi:hypothetical protein